MYTNTMQHHNIYQQYTLTSVRIARFISTLSRDLRISRIFSVLPSPLGLDTSFNKSSFRIRTEFTPDIIDLQI